MALQVDIKNSTGTLTVTSLSTTGAVLLNTKNKYIDDYIVVDVVSTGREDEYLWNVVLKLTKPTMPVASFEYTGSLITPTINDFDSSKETKSGVYEATDIGDYIVTISINDTDNYEWVDSTTSPVGLNWSITRPVWDTNPKTSAEATALGYTWITE